MGEILTALESLLTGYDTSMTAITENEVWNAISALRNSADVDPPREWVAESIGFAFCERDGEPLKAAGDFFGPLLAWSMGDGTTREVPDKSRIDAGTIDYWTRRAHAAVHPVLITRYANLVWEYAEIVTGNAPAVECARMVIDGSIRIAELRCHKHEVDVIKKLARARSLALLLRDAARCSAVKQAILDLEKRIAVDDKPGLWGFSYDLLVEGHKPDLPSSELQQIILSLEQRLLRVSGRGHSPDPDPWAAEHAALRLATFYRKASKSEDMARVLRLYADAFRKAGAVAQPLQASAWLQRVHSVLVDFGMKDDAERIAIEIRQLGPSVAAGLKPIEHAIEIPEPRLREFVQAMTSGDLPEALSRIAAHFVPDRAKAQAQLTDLAGKYPLSYLVTTIIVDRDGRPVATAGPLDSDVVGQLVRRISQNMEFSSPFLSAVLGELVRRGEFTEAMLLDYLKRSPALNERQDELLARGIGHYLSGRHIEAAHVLIPCIERALRNLVEIAGGAVLRGDRRGGMDYRQLGDLLSDETLIGVVGEDASLYFRVLLTDKRGWNLRNTICHGLARAQDIGERYTDRLLHVLLCLAQIREDVDSV